MTQMSKLKDWEMKCEFEFDVAQDAYQLIRVENALFDLLSDDERSGSLGQKAWESLYNKYGLVKCLEAGERLLAKGRCGSYHGGLYTL